MSQHQEYRGKGFYFYAALICYVLSAAAVVSFIATYLLDVLDNNPSWAMWAGVIWTVGVTFVVVVVWALVRWRNSAWLVMLISVPLLLSVALIGAIILSIPARPEEMGIGGAFLFLFLRKTILLFGFPMLLVLPGAGLLTWRFHRRVYQELNDADRDVSLGWGLVVFEVLILLVCILVAGAAARAPILFN